MDEVLDEYEVQGFMDQPNFWTKTEKKIAAMENADSKA